MGPDYGLQIDKFYMLLNQMNARQGGSRLQYCSYNLEIKYRGRFKRIHLIKNFDFHCYKKYFLLTLEGSNFDSDQF